MAHRGLGPLARHARPRSSASLCAIRQADRAAPFIMPVTHAARLIRSGLAGSGAPPYGKHRSAARPVPAVGSSATCKLAIASVCLCLQAASTANLCFKQGNN
jgi:hypothetical protein